MNKDERLILRFKKPQIYAHWIFAISFFVLTISGLILVIPGMAVSFGAASGVLHRLAAVTFMGAVVYYYFADREGLTRLIKESFTYDKDDIAWIKKMMGYCFGRTKDMPPSGRLNGGEKLHHAVIIITFLTISFSGIMLWLGSGSMSTTVFLLMIWMHYLSMLAMVCLTIGHIYFTFLYGASQHMITGYTTESYAQKHVKWLDDLKSKGMM